ncbi:MAG: hypothetical protein ABJF01_07970 [bacterium]
MSHAQYRPPDHSKGNEETIGGYAAVHDRPAAFEGSDGFSYSVEIVAEQETTGETDNLEKWDAFFLFVKWARLGAQTPEGHLESDYLAAGSSESEAKAILGETPIGHVKALLDQLIAHRRGVEPARPWWDAMRAEDGGT